jgi:hypothetical protein
MCPILCSRFAQEERHIDSPVMNYYRNLFAAQEPPSEQRHFNSNSMNSSRVVPVLRTARVTPGFCQ